MPLIAQMFAVIAAILHIWFFVLESILWRRPPTWRRFRVASQEDADTIAPMARNQGFYNLFLALGVLCGVWLARVGSFPLPFDMNQSVGQGVALFACLCMVGAGIVLALGDRRFLPAALVQAVPPALAIVTAVAFKP
jgi:putative membrane protein